MPQQQATRTPPALICKAEQRLRVVQDVVAIGRRQAEPLDVDEGLLAAGHEMACAERLVGALKPTSCREPLAILYSRECNGDDAAAGTGSRA